MVQWLIKIRNAVLDFLFPSRCVRCGREGAFLCLPCLRQLKISPSLMHATPDSALDGLIYVFKYSANPAIRSAIHQLKYRFNEDLAKTLAALMLKKINRLSLIDHDSAILIPVPLHRSRQWWRGFNQAERLTEAMRRLADLSVCHGLTRTRATEQQAMLGRKQRLKNLKNSFQALPALRAVDRGSTLFLVDDVCTTGSTLQECARAEKRGF